MTNVNVKETATKTVNAVVEHDVTQQSWEALSSAGRSVVRLTGASIVAVALTTEVTAKGAAVAVETVNVGLTVAAESMPETAEETQEMLLSLFEAEPSNQEDKADA